ncbi:potassium channel family protein [Halococcus hamelinensis]|uniref:TrkA-C domain-containing protein n=1 Tax=Halococcus hamelinensis 100A6 TaxID=1132509 RepID=M0M544_9EURY|nr:NAD(P)-binding protein [Halococcus hamelinensis]EMA40498.1 TrkA-C domain-containing protein [Halococcus hamelinensis 100A6]
MSSEKPQGPLEQQLRQLRSVSSLEDLTNRQRTVVKYIVVLVSVLVSYAVIYQAGMRTLEGDDITIFRALQTVVETMTTTGYGAGAPWVTPYMNLLIIWYQISGVLIGLVTLRILIIPLFERAPVVLDDRLTTKDDHVVVCEYGRGKDVLLDEFEASGIDYVLVDPDKEEAIDLSNRDYQVIDGDPTRTETLRRAGVEDAALVVTDARARNASVALTAYQCNDDVRVLSLTETPDRQDALEQVGVDRVVCVPSLIGRQLAEKATATATFATAADAIGDGTVVRELVVRHDGPLAGARVEDTPIVANPDLTLVGAWIDGELRLPPRSSERLSPNSVLVVVGPEAAFEGIHDEDDGFRSLTTYDSVVVAGLGEAGTAVTEHFPDEVDVTTIDVDESTGADVVGNASDGPVLAEAGIEDATALVVAVDDDETALLATAVGRSMAEEIDILVRVTNAEDVAKGFDAGADYVLSERRTIARLLAAEAHREPVVHPIGQIRFARVESDEFVGQDLGEIQRNANQEWVGVGLERDGEFLTDDTIEIADSDTLVVAGTDERLRRLPDE